MYILVNESNTDALYTLRGKQHILKPHSSLQCDVLPTSYTRQIKVVNVTQQKAIVKGRPTPVKVKSVYTDSRAAADKSNSSN